MAPLTLRAVDGHRIGRLHRLLRQRAGLTQAEIGRRTGVGRWRIIDLEAGRLSSLRLGEEDRCLSALGARLDVRAWYQGAAADRLLDEAHAALVAAVVAQLTREGWAVKIEVSFSEFGERGSIDILAWHAETRVLLVIEVKSELGSIEGTLRPFGIKCRLAAKIARDQFGWHAATIGRILVLPEQRTARRAVERHATVLNATLPMRSRQLRSWVREPSGTIAGIWFLSDVGTADVTRNLSAIRRVRHARPRTRRAAKAGLDASDVITDPRNVGQADK